MIQLSDRVNRISPSMTFAISSQAKSLKAQGIDVCDFSVGEPDFVTPSHIRDAAKEALDAGRTKYTPTAGLPALRERIAAKLRSENGLDYTAEQILVTTGGKQALFNSLMVLLNPGDEALIPAPAWVTYPEIVKIAGAMPTLVHTTEATEFKVTPDQLSKAITSRSRVFILNSPSNPTGAVYTADELAGLAEVIVDQGLIVVADEIYEKLIYDGLSHTSIGSLGEEVLSRTITVNGFSKAYAATGWRLGYAAGPAPVIEAATSLQSHSTSGANTFAQYGALTALEGPQEEIAEMRDTFERRRDLIVDELRGIPGISCAQPHGAFYVFPNIAATGLDSMDFCKELLEDQHVATVPGVAFGADTNIRISYATDLDTIREGLVRLREFVETVRA